MSYLNGITTVKNKVVTHLEQEMSMLFRVTDIDRKQESKLRSLLNQHTYEGNFELGIHDNKIMYVNYLTGYSDDWECYGADEFANFVEDCIGKL